MNLTNKELIDIFVASLGNIHYTPEQFNEEFINFIFEMVQLNKKKDEE